MPETIVFETTLDRLPKKGGEFFMMVPDEVATRFVEGRKPARIRCCLNESVTFQCAIRPKGGGGFYINVGTRIRQEGKFVLGQKLFAKVWKDDSQFGRDMPEELKALLEVDEEGSRLFHELRPSEQRAIIYYVDGAKSQQVRIDRAIMLINRLKVGKGEVRSSLVLFGVVDIQ